MHGEARFLELVIQRVARFQNCIPSAGYGYRTPTTRRVKALKWPFGIKSESLQNVTVYSPLVKKCGRDLPERPECTIRTAGEQ
jgi:hypothetical protein